LLARFAPEPEAALSAFADFMAEDAAQERLWDQRRNQIFLGSAAFASDAWTRAATGEAQPSPAKSLDWYAEHYPDRYEAMARAHLEGGYPQPEVAGRFGVHFSTVSRAASRLAQDLAR
jgi:hypothetical protein